MQANTTLFWGKARHDDDAVSGMHPLAAKCRDNDEFVVVGHGTGATGRMTLLLGAQRGDTLVYLGRVGSGIGERQERDLARRLAPLCRETPALAKVPAGERRTTTWVEPQLVAEVDYAGWTADGLLRQASFKGIQEDKPAAEVGVPRPGEAPPAPRTVSQGGAGTVAGIRLSRPEKLFWPEEGVTMQGLLHLIRQVPVAGERAPYLAIDSLEGLVALAQMEMTEIHPWGARAADVEHPDRLVFDLDPAEDVPFAQVVMAVQEMRERLERPGLAAFCKTTGGKGLHMATPLRPKADWPEAKAFCRALCEVVAADQGPLHHGFEQEGAGRTDLPRLSQGRPGATAVAAWSPRARPGATISMPLAWRAVIPTLDPKRFIITSAPGLLRRKDLRADLEQAAVPLPKLH